MTRVLAVWMLTVAAASPFGGKAHRKAEEGNRLYAEGQLDDALRAYTEAQVAAPDAPELLYDIGNVLYRNEDPVSAEEAYAKALASAPPGWAGAAAYNHGNALFAQGRFEDAAASYRRALEFDPRDLDAKRNLELSLRRAEQQQQQQQQQQDSGEDQQQDTSQGSEGPQQDPPEAQEQDSGQDPQEQQQPQEPGDPGEEPGTPRPQDGEPRGDERPEDAGKGGSMSREEAERLLDGLEGEERENLRRLAEREANSEGVRREKDW